MNTYYESFLRRDIFTHVCDKEYIDIIIQAYDSDDSQKHYISMVLEDYIKGASAFTTRKRLFSNVIAPIQCMKRKYGDYDKEFEEHMKGGN